MKKKPLLETYSVGKKVYEGCKDCKFYSQQSIVCGKNSRKLNLFIHSDRKPEWCPGREPLVPEEKRTFMQWWKEFRNKID